MSASSAAYFFASSIPTSLKLICFLPEPTKSLYEIGEWFKCILESVSILCLFLPASRT